MLVSIDLLFKFGKRTNILYLFERLRYEAKFNGGYFNRGNLTKNELYKLIPVLEEMGWVKGNKVTKYRSILTKEVDIFNFTKIEEKDLKSIEAFRSFVIACTETYLMSWRYKIQQKTGKRFSARDREWDHKWVYTGAALGEQKFNVEKFSDSKFSGRLADEIIASSLGVSIKTVYNWRRTLKINEYTTKKRVHKDVYNTDNFYFSKTLSKFLTVDRIISTNIYIFNNKYTKYRV